MRHILFTLRGCPFGLLDDEAHIRNVLANAATLSESTLLGIQSHKFQPQGVTAVALLAESHISIHTYQRKAWQSVMCLHVETILIQSLVLDTCMMQWVQLVLQVNPLNDLWNEHLCHGTMPT